MPELVAVDVSRPPPEERTLEDELQKRIGNTPVRKYELAAGFRPVHSTDHGSLVGDADAQCFEDVIRTCESFQPNYSIKLNMALLVELDKRLYCEVAHVGFFQGIVSCKRIFCHPRDTSNSERDAQKSQHSFTEVSKCRSRICGVVVQHGHKDIGSAQALSKLDDDGQLID